jgi:hypothetical protein
MKKLFTLISFILMTGLVSAQFIYTDFDDNQNVEFTGWPNAPTAIANPDQSGINTSANVGEWMRSTEQWAHVYAELDEKINFNTGTSFSLKIWSPIACEVLFKLEDKNDNTIFVEVPASVETANEWVELTFDFSNAASDTYDKVVIFMDFSSTDENTFYFDDIMGPEFGGGGGGPTGAYIYNDADNNQNEELLGWPNVPAVITNPDPSGINTSDGVAEWERSEEMWAHVSMELSGKVDFSTGEQFYLKAWSPIACEVLFKLEDKNESSTFVEVSQNIDTPNEWVQLAFDFSGSASDTYDKIVIFMDFSTTTTNTFYIDDIQGPEYVTASVNENMFKAAELYPNPASEQIQVKGIQLVERIEIYNTTGQLVIRQESMQESVDISGLQPGLYTVMIEDQKGELYLSKLIKN